MLVLLLLLAAAGRCHRYCRCFHYNLPPLLPLLSLQLPPFLPLLSLQLLPFLQLLSIQLPSFLPLLLSLVIGGLGCMLLPVVVASGGYG